MTIIKPGNRSNQPSSKQTSLQPLLQSAQGSEKHEEEVDMEDAELLIGFSHAVWDQYDAKRNSSAPSTKSEELLGPEPGKEPGKEVEVPSVNASLQVQDGEEHVTSMANALEVNEDVATERIGDGASNLNPLLIEESDSDSGLPTWDHPSSAPEGSLLHAVYLQLVRAGTKGITKRELFKWLKKPAQVHSFAGDWKVQVQRHLKTNPHFGELQGHHYLQGQQPNRSPANIASTSRRYGASSSKPVLSAHHATPATVQPGHSVDTHEGVVRTRRKAFQKAIAALSEQATEYEEMLQSMGNMQIPSSIADPTDSQLVSHEPLLTSSRKRKSPSSDEEELTHHGHPIPEGLQATQAQILANTEVQTTQRCVVTKDDSGNWRCNMIPMPGDIVCKHHRSLQQEEDGESALSPSPGSPKNLPAFKTWIAPEAGVQTQLPVQCGHRHKSQDGTRSSQCSRIAMKGDRLCEHHKKLREESKARQRADAQQGKKDATSNPDSSNMGLPESHTNLDQSLVPHHPQPATLSPRISREDTPSRTEAAKNVDKPATGAANHDGDPDGKQLQQPMPKNGPSRHHVAAKKFAANVGPLKSQGPIRTPTVFVLPPSHGIRRKTPVKTRDH